MEKNAVKFTKEQVRRLKRIALEQKLKGSEILNEFTDDQMIESFNGAGSCAAPEWQRWVLTKILEKKLPAVLIHDMAYRKGGTAKDFARVNGELKENMLKLDEGDKSRWWRFVADKAKTYSDQYGSPGWSRI